MRSTENIPEARFDSLVQFLTPENIWISGTPFVLKTILIIHVPQAVRFAKDSGKQFPRIPENWGTPGTITWKVMVLQIHPWRSQTCLGGHVEEDLITNRTTELSRWKRPHWKRTNETIHGRWWSSIFLKASRDGETTVHTSQINEILVVATYECFWSSYSLYSNLMELNMATRSPL